MNRMKAFVLYLDHDHYRISLFSLGLQKDAAIEEASWGMIYRVKNTALLPSFPTVAGEPHLMHYIKVLWNKGVQTLQPFELKDWSNKVGSLISRVHESDPIDIVISSYAPLEAHMAALGFLGNYKNVPWITDMRDEMSLNPHVNHTMRSTLRKMESKINERACAVTTVSEPILNDFKKLLPKVKRQIEIRNGFDHDLKRETNFNEVFTIVYAGTFYGQRKPDTFFEGLKSIVSTDKIEVIIKFIGTHRNFVIPPELEESCVFFPKMPIWEALQHMALADANLLVLPPVSGKGVYSGKIFDYLSVQKPIIAIVDLNDVAAHLINELKAGFCADFSDITQIKSAITAAYNMWKERKLLMMEPEKIASLHRRVQVQKLQSLIQQILVR